VTLIVAISGCSARDAETRDKNVVVCGWIAGPDSFNPYTAIGAAASMVAAEIYTPLVDIGPKLLPRYSTSLAYKVDIDRGGRRYLLHLRKNARWSDGLPIDADDVIFALNIASNPLVISSSPGDFALLQAVRAPDRFSVEIILSHPSPAFLANALGGTVPLPAHLLRKYPGESEQEARFLNADAEFAQHPVVSGPFRIKRNVRDAYLLLESNPAYWGPKTHLKEVAFRVYPAQDSLFAAVDAGEVDVTDIPPNLWRVHQRLRGAHRFVNWPWNVTFMLLPNYADKGIPFFHDRTVRQAIMHAINRDFIVHGIMSGQADILNGPIPSFSPYYDRSVVKYRYDPQHARQLLDADGWKLQGNVRVKDGLPLRFTLKTGGATDAVASNIAELIQADLRAVGIDCVLVNEEIQAFFSDLANTKFQVALRGRILRPYPDDYSYYHSSQTRARGGHNIGSFANPLIDRLLVAARTAPSPALARKALDDYQKEAALQVPVIYLYSNRLGAVVPPDLSGYELTPNAPAALPMGLEFWRRKER
jgi:peptide/nickel transport system substrate-binding protein